MVTLGFIAEGATEKMILESPNFHAYLASLNINFIPNVIDANGNGNLLPHNLLPHTQLLKNNGATNIFILTDLDKDQCFTITKSRISAPKDHIITISAKSVESWFLADSDAMRSFLNDANFSYNNPENILDPFEEIRQIRLSKWGIGVSSKTTLAKQLISKHNFSISNAALHPNCESAKYFLNKVRELSDN